ncbi:MAG TPA: hypothetical protein VH092_36215 [Urbifossiella sp.]|nr:hypothetical protein [Urbifossiella sp.]
MLAAFDQTGYRGYLTFECRHPYPPVPGALIYRTAALDRRLGLKTRPAGRAGNDHGRA